MRDQSPTDGVCLRCPSLETHPSSRVDPLLPLVSRNNASGLNVLTDALPYQFTLARTIRERTQQLTCDTICVWDRVALDDVRIARSFFAISSEPDG